MDIRQLEFFTAVAEERNFTRAAELSHVTQSGMSASIRALERELGVRLFERSARTVELTAAGHTFLPRARSMLADARAAQRELFTAAGTSQELVRVGSEQCVGDLVDLVDLLAEFRDRHPCAELAFEQARSAALVDRLSQDELDVAIVALPIAGSVGPSSRGVKTLELRRESFVLLAPPDHELAVGDAVGWDELERLPFVDLSRAWVVRQVIDDSFSSRRRSRRTAMTVDDIHLLLRLVARGFGVALLPASIAAKPEAGALARCAVNAPELGWELHLATSDRAGPLARAFARMLIPSLTAAALRDEVSAQRPAGPVRASMRIVHDGDDPSLLDASQTRS